MKRSMKSLFAGALVAMTICGSFVSFARRDESLVRREIDAQYARFLQAFRQKDITILKRILASGFMAESERRGKKPPHAPMSRVESLKGWGQWFTVLEWVQSYRTTITSLKVGGNRANVIVQQSMTFTERGGSRGHRHAHIWGPSRDMWIRSASGWQLVHSVDLASQRMTERWDKKAM